MHAGGGWGLCLTPANGVTTRRDQQDPAVITREKGAYVALLLGVMVKNLPRFRCGRVTIRLCAAGAPLTVPRLSMRRIKSYGAGSISQTVRLYRSPVGAVSLTVTVVPAGDSVVTRCTQKVSPTGARYW
jgi:hypothetical protein